MQAPAVGFWPRRTLKAGAAICGDPGSQGGKYEPAPLSMLTWQCVHRENHSRVDPYAASARPWNFVFRCSRLHSFVCRAFFFPAFLSAKMRRIGARRLFAGGRSHSVWGRRYGFLLAQRHTEHQQRRISLAFLAPSHCFLDCSSRRSRHDRDCRHLRHSRESYASSFTSSLGCL